MARPKKETLEHAKAFETYLSMGENRSTAAVARQLGKSKAAIDNWSSQFQWVRRVDEAEKRIAEKSSAKLESRLVDAQTRQLSIAQAVQGLFIKRLKTAIDEKGNFVKGGYKPSAIDAKVWADLEREIVSTGEGTGAIGFNPAALEGMDIERLERIVIERATRIAAIRKRSPKVGG